MMKMLFFKASTSLLVIVAVALFETPLCSSRSHHKKQTKITEDFLQNALAEEDSDVVTDEIDDFLDAESYSGDEESDHCSSPAASRNTDEYVDNVLEAVRPRLPEPFFLPERVGRFRLFNGTLSNLQSMRRAGPAMVKCSDSAFSFHVPVSFKDLTGRYFWETDTGVPVFRGFIDLFAGEVEADVLYSRKRQGYAEREDSQMASVEEFKITKLEGVRVVFDGLGPLNQFASRQTSLVARFFSRGLSRVIEGPVKNAINKELKNVGKYEKYYF